VFSWEVFSTQFKKAYDQLEDNGIAIPTAKKLCVIKSKINTRNIAFNMLAKSALTYDPNDPNCALTECLSRVAAHMATEFPSQQAQGHRYRPGIASVHAGDDMIHKEIIGGCTMCNGVDITDKVRKYPPNEWHALLFAL
jgi:hypothetical protein